MKVALHLGLGDAIICAPIIAKLASENNEVIVPSWARNLESVKSLFVNYPNVKVEVVTDHNLPGFENAELRLGVYNQGVYLLPGESFVHWFFRQAGMSEDERWKWCPIQKAAESFVQYEDSEQWPNRIERGTRLSFVHEDHARGFVISGYHLDGWGIHYVQPNELPILAYVKWLKNAPSIHCIDSSFLHLAEAVPTTGKLFYHQYARPNSTDNYQFRKQWTILK